MNKTHTHTDKLVVCSLALVGYFAASFLCRYDILLGALTGALHFRNNHMILTHYLYMYINTGEC